MSNQTAKYVITYFSSLLTDKERLAIRHSHSLLKLDNTDETDEQNQRRTNMYKKQGWLTDDKEVLELQLLDTDFDQALIKINEKYSVEYPDIKDVAKEEIISLAPNPANDNVNIVDTHGTILKLRSLKSMLAFKSRTGLFLFRVRY